MSTLWLITVGWGDCSLVDFLARSSRNDITKLEVYHWFFAHIQDVILNLDYSPLDNIEGDLDLMPILNKDIEHELLDIDNFNDFLPLNLQEIEQYMRENGQAHGMVVTVSQAKAQNYQIILLDDGPHSPVWKVTYNIRPFTCVPPASLPNLFDAQQSTRSDYLWQIRAKGEHHVYQYIFEHLDQFHLSNLPALMKRTPDELVKMVQLPLAQTDHRVISEMINIQCCNVIGAHQHEPSENRYVLLVEPALNLLDIIDVS